MRPSAAIAGAVSGLKKAKPEDPTTTAFYWVTSSRHPCSWCTVLWQRELRALPSHNICRQLVSLSSRLLVLTKEGKGPSDSFSKAAILSRMSHAKDLGSISDDTVLFVGSSSPH